MCPSPLGRFALPMLLAASIPACLAQTAPLTSTAPATEAAKTETASQGDAGRISVQANLVVVPAVVSDKKGLVTTLTQKDFSITVDGKPQPVRYFDLDKDVPLTVGLLVDVSRSQEAVLDEEQKASQKFLDSFLKPAAGSRPADKAFILQFAHSAELLQDITDSRPLLAAALKEIGTQAPGTADDDHSQDQAKDDPSTTGSGNNPNSNGGGGNGGYGRRGGYPGGSGNGGSGGNSRGNGARGGTVLYDSVFLASDDLLARQKGRRALVVLTDGVDRHSKESLIEAIEAAQRADTVVYAIYYKGHEAFDRGPSFGGPGGYGGYGRSGYPGSGGRPGSDGTYADPDGRKILQRMCSETGGRLYELKGKGSIDTIYGEIGDELRAQYRLGFTPTAEAASVGYHPLQVSLTSPANKKLEIQTREGYYTGTQKPR